MKQGLLRTLCLTSVFAAMGLAKTQAQVIIGLTGEMRNWDRIQNINIARNRASIDTDQAHGGHIALNGPYRDEGQPNRFAGPLRMDVGITAPFTGTLRFTYIGVSWDVRGWGDGAGNLYESVGYSINGVDYQLSPDSGNGTDGFYSDNLLYPDGEQFGVFLEEGDFFTFYLTTLDSLGNKVDGFGNTIQHGTAHLYLQDFSFTAVPEPGEWMALAGVGLIGFAGVRRWRKNHALNG